tara:strand:+ start:4220 stop:4975 length:756 start_codon:yes stop_codon:yes gene_type:complete
MPKILKAKDISDKFIIKKDILPDIPFRMLIVGRSGSGKSNVLSCLVALDDWYGDDFKGDNIYLWSGSKGDEKINKLIEYKEIPDVNVRHEWFDTEVSEVYDELVDDWKEKVDEGERPNDVLFIVDDMFYSNKFANSRMKDSMMSKVFMNGRKFNISIVILAQKYSSISSALRENANAIFTFGATNKQIELMEGDFNYLPSSKDFYRVFRSATNGSKHDFLFINIDRPINERYMNKEFKSIYPFDDEKEKEK